MADLAVGDRVLLTLVGSFFGQRTMNTFLYRVVSTAASTPVATALAALHAKISDTGELLEQYKNALTTSWISTQVWLQVISPTRQRKQSFAWGGTGQFDSPASSSNLQASITRFGAGASRKDVGGIRVPMGTGSDSVIDGYLTDEFINRLDDLGDQMDADITVAAPAAVYRPQIGIPKPPATSVDMIGWTVQPQARVLRRRTVGFGI